MGGWPPKVDWDSWVKMSGSSSYNHMTVGLYSPQCKYTVYTQIADLHWFPQLLPQP